MEKIVEAVVDGGNNVEADEGDWKSVGTGGVGEDSWVAGSESIEIAGIGIESVDVALFS